MANLRIAFRTDANELIGTGHFIRCLALADELRRQGCEIAFVTRGLPQHLKTMLEERRILLLEPSSLKNSETMDELAHAHWLGTSQEQDAQQTIHLLGTTSWDWLVCDHYALDNRFETMLRPVAQNIMVIDDLADRVHDCDVLLDQNFYIDQEVRYQGKVPLHCQMLLGPTYALLRPEFKQVREQAKIRSGEVRNILVFFGGVDASNQTGKALQALIDMHSNIQVDVVIGMQHPHKKEIKELCELNDFNYHVQTNQMATLMSKADLAIGAGGTAVWERFCLGLPSFCIATANNQIQQLNDLQNAGFMFCEPNWNHSTKALTNFLQNIGTKRTLLKGISEKISTLVDGNGSSKTVSALKANMLKIRLVKDDDAQNIFEWRNHPNIRNNSQNSEVISWTDHQKWFKERLSGKNGPLLIGEVNHLPIGVVRFDVHQSDAEVSIYGVPGIGSKGWGSLLLKKSEFWLKQQYPQVLNLRAKVLPDNTRSINLFEKLNYIAKAHTSPMVFEKLMERCQ
jgi:UDP-2,4-diacetamido-2,4,6-trideoxy-beta-L-altropyranose hydrolase